MKKSRTCKKHLDVDTPASTPFWRTLPRRLRKTIPLLEPSDERVRGDDKVLGRMDDLDAQRLFTLHREIMAEMSKFQIRRRPGDKEKAAKLSMRADVVKELIKLRVAELFGLAEDFVLKVCQNWVIVDASVDASPNGGPGGLKKMLLKALTGELRGGPGLPPPFGLGLGNPEELPDFPFGPGREDLDP